MVSFVFSTHETDSPSQCPISVVLQVGLYSYFLDCFSYQILF